MTPREAVQLTGYIQAHFPSQPINEFTPDALGELLADYPMADCRAAVLALSRRGDGDRTRWCSPSDVAAEVRRIRSKRIADGEAQLTPPPEAREGSAHRAWLRDAKRRLGDGEPVEAINPPALDGKARHLPDLRAIAPKPERAA